MDSLESEGKTVAEAVDAALHKMGLNRDQVEVQILQEPTSGFMGLGSKPARVRITEKIWGERSAEGGAGAGRRTVKREEPEGEGYEFPPHEKSDFPSDLESERGGAGAGSGERGRGRGGESRRSEPRRGEFRGARGADRGERVDRGRRSQPAQTHHHRPSAPPSDTAAAAKAAQAALDETIKLMGFNASVKAEWDARQERVRAPLEGPDAGLLVGPDGSTLEALQLVVTLVASRKLGEPVAVQVDAAGYWAKREDDILSKARRGIEEVKRTGKPYRLEPMDASMRRLIHRNLTDNPDVETASEGEGSWRKIVIRPRKK